MRRIHFITFGNENYYEPLKRINEQAKKIDIFTDIHIIDDKKIKEDKIFWDKHGEFINENKRGYGYWIWKSYIVNKLLLEIEDNDIIIYCDAGCEININGKERLKEYIEIVNNSKYGILSFEMVGLLEKKYTKMKTFIDLDCLSQLETNQLMATSFILKKCLHTVFLLNEYYNNCCNYSLINDNYYNIKNDIDFIDHRHDQSIFSLLRKKYGTEILVDETYFGPKWEKNKCFKYPILCTRNKKLNTKLKF